jgi:hypothetical protein
MVDEKKRCRLIWYSFIAIIICCCQLLLVVVIGGHVQKEERNDDGEQLKEAVRANNLTLVRELLENGSVNPGFDASEFGGAMYLAIRDNRR